jgi:hypothetical protein
MKTLLVGLVLSLCFAATSQAEESTGKPDAEFETRKAAAIKRLDERTEGLAKLKTCMTAAASPDALKTCHKDHKEAMSGMQLDMMNDRMERMQKHHDRMAEKIKEREAKKSGSEKSESEKK